MQLLVQFAHAIADETRWRMIQLLFSEALCVCEIAEIMDMPQSSVSSHLQVIRKAGLLENERCEKWIYYRIEPQSRSLLTTIAESLEVSAAGKAILNRDAKRAVKRLARRAETCCPGPKQLASPSHKKSVAT